MLRLPCLLMVSLVAFACGKSFPDNWRELGLPTEHLVTATEQAFGPAAGKEMIALYSTDVSLGELAAGWDTALSARGFQTLCSREHDDGSLTRGYKSSDTRYLMSTAKLGDSAHELHLLIVPDEVPDAEVCAGG